MIATFAFPLLSSNSANAAQVDIARMRRRMSITMLPDVGVAPRWDHNALHPVLLARLIGLAFIVAAVSAHLVNFFRCIQQLIDLTGIIGSRLRHTHFLNFQRFLIHADVKFTPGAVLSIPMLTHLPLALAVH